MTSTFICHAQRDSSPACPQAPSQSKRLAQAHARQPSGRRCWRILCPAHALMIREKRCRSAVCRKRQPAHRPYYFAPVGQDCGIVRHSLPKPQTCYPTSAHPRRLRRLRYPPARRWHLREAAPRSDCPHPQRADQRLPPLIVLRISVLRIVLVVIVRAKASASHSASAWIYSLLEVLLLLELLRPSEHSTYLLVFLLLGILIPLMIPAFGENFGPTSAKGSARPSLSSTHYGRER